MGGQPHLLASGVEGLLYQAPCLRHVALLQQWEVVRVLEGDLQLAVLRLLQGVQEVLWEPACRQQVPLSNPDPGNCRVPQGLWATMVRAEVLDPKDLRENQRAWGFPATG